MKLKLALPLLGAFLLSVPISFLVFVFLQNRVSIFVEGQSAGLAFSFIAIFQNLSIAILTIPIFFMSNRFYYLKFKLIYLLASPILVMMLFPIFFLANPVKTPGLILSIFSVPSVVFAIMNWIVSSDPIRKMYIK